MAAPTPSVYERQTGRHGFKSWHAVWTDTNNLTDTVVIDLSAQLNGHTNSLIIDRVSWVATAGIEFTLEFDATTDEFIISSVLAIVDDQDIDFTWGGRNGLVKTESGATGDLLITTTSAASADEILLFVWYSLR